MLTGCATAPEPELNFCQRANRLLGNESADPFQKQALLEKMRGEGCFDRR